MAKPGHLCTLRPLLHAEGDFSCCSHPCTCRRSGEDDHEESLRERLGERAHEGGQACWLAGASLMGIICPGHLRRVILNQEWRPPNPSPGRFGDIPKQFQLPQMKGYYWQPVGRGRRCCYPPLDERIAPLPQQQNIFQS